MNRGRLGMDRSRAGVGGNLRAATELIRRECKVDLEKLKTPLRTFQVSCFFTISTRLSVQSQH